MFLQQFGSAPKINTIIHTIFEICQPFCVICYNLVVEYDIYHIELEAVSHEQSPTAKPTLGRAT